jgi:hypothetical protein
MNKVIALLAVIGTMLSLCSNANAADIYVPMNYPTIQAAINSANYGDVIWLDGRQYNESIVIAKSGLTIRSYDSSRKASITGTGIITIDVYAGSDYLYLRDLDINIVNSGYGIYTRGTIYYPEVYNCNIINTGTNEGWIAFVDFNSIGMQVKNSQLFGARYGYYSLYGNYTYVDNSYFFGSANSYESFHRGTTHTIVNSGLYNGLEAICGNGYRGDFYLTNCWVGSFNVGGIGYFDIHGSGTNSFTLSNTGFDRCRYNYLFLEFGAYIQSESGSTFPYCGRWGRW